MPFVFKEAVRRLVIKDVMRKYILKVLISALAVGMFNVCYGEAFKIEVFDKKLILKDDCRLPVTRSVGDKEIVILCESPETLPTVTITISEANKCTTEKFDTYLAKADDYIHYVVKNETIDGIWYLEYTSNKPGKNNVYTTRQVSDRKSCYKAQSFSKEYLNLYTKFLWQW